MKKQLSILSVLTVVALSFILTSCGAKKDEALIADFNSRRADADKLMKMMEDGSKQMIGDHAMWTAKLDSAAKAGADQAKVDGFKAEMKKHDDMAKSSAMMDSIHAYYNAKTETNDQLKAAIAGLDAQIAAGNSSCNMFMEAHKKLGADITAFLGGAAPADASKPAEKAEPAKKTAGKTQAAPPDAPKMDMTKHAVKPAEGGTTRRGSGATIK
ncbi:MAG: hypothetical protein WCH46_06970 [bacterium]